MTLTREQIEEGRKLVDDLMNNRSGGKPGAIWAWLADYFGPLCDLALRAVRPPTLTEPFEKPSPMALEAAARALCKAEGDNPDAVGDPPNDVGAARLDHAFPRWMTYRRRAQTVIDAYQAAEPGREARDAVLEAISKAGTFSVEIPCAVTVHFEYGPDAWDLLHSLHAFKSSRGSNTK